MDEKRIYKLSLLLPIIVPLICFVPLILIGDLVPDRVAWLLFVTFLTLLFGGIPYLVLATLLFIFMRSREPRRIRDALLLSPLLMLPLFYIFASAFELISGNYSFSTLTFDDVAYPTMMLSAYILIYGYFYVFLTFALVKMFTRKPLENLSE